MIKKQIRMIINLSGKQLEMLYFDHMLVIDAFPANNETRLAELRIKYLSPVVDFTVIGESGLSHSGKAKPLFFAEWLKEARNEDFFKNVIVIEVDLAAYSTSWAREIATREHIAEYIRTKFPNSCFILSDLDEIPSIRQIEIATRVRQNFHFLTPTSYLYANWQPRDSHKHWNRGVVGNTSLELGPNGGRFVKWQVIEESPGAHLSWILGISGELETKLLSTAHEELASRKVLNTELISYAARFGVDHLGRFYNEGFGVFLIQERNTLSDVQVFVFSQAPSLFKFDLLQRNIFFRWIASAVCTAIWSAPLCSREIHETFVRKSFFRIGSLPAIFFLLRTVAIGLLLLLKRKFRSMLILR